MAILLLGGPLPAEPVLRARVTAIQPPDLYVRLFFARGPNWNELTRENPRPPTLDESRFDWGRSEASNPLDDALNPTIPGVAPSIIREEGPAYTILWIRPGVWTPAIPLSTFSLYTTFHLVAYEKLDARRPRDPSRRLESAVVEFEILDGETRLRSFTERVGASGRLTIRLPAVSVSTNGAASPERPSFFNEPMGLEEFVRTRADALAALPEASGPRPHRYGFLTACSGWDRNASVPDIWRSEYRALRCLGINGLMYDTWPGFESEVCNGPPEMRAFRRLRGFNLNQILEWPAGGFLIPAYEERDPRRSEAEGWGCPSHPAHRDLDQRLERAVVAMMDRLRQMPYEEYWAQTVDEIGSFFDRSAEGKAHPGVCPWCSEAFRNYLRGYGLTPADFGVDSWEPIHSTYAYTHRRTPTGRGTAPSAESAPARPVEAEEDFSLRDRDDPAETPPPQETREKPAGLLERGIPPPFPDYGWALLTYHSRRFNNEATARIFTPLRRALEAQNDRKQRALADGRLDSPEARQPWIYAGALRSNTFLLGGHSLDFFDWYRHADNAFMYETSNRDPRVWPWDSYLCDVGRIHQEKLGTRFCIMIKPSRGAVVQRTLAALGRGVRMIYWYTYGPDWHHPDTFARDWERLKTISRLARMIGDAEDRLYDARWAEPARVAVVRPFTSAVFENNASWENGKWIYTLLQHLHIPVDPLDEGYLMSEDLSQYRVIIVSGSHLRRDTAEKLRAWVYQGGVLITSGGGLARDESDRPLHSLREVLGISERTVPTLWGEVRRYGATTLAPISPVAEPPAGSFVLLEPEGGDFELAIGRERWQPSSDSEALGRYADGGVAILRHRFGRGWAVVFGYYAGLEYAADVMREDFDMARHFAPIKRATMDVVLRQAGVEPPIAISHPLVRGCDCAIPAMVGRRFC